MVVTATRPGDDGCKIGPEPRSVGSGQLEQIELKLDAPCDVQSSASITFAFDSVGVAVKPPSEILTVKTAKAAPFNWPILGWAFLIAVGVVGGPGFVNPGAAVPAAPLAAATDRWPSSLRSRSPVPRWEQRLVSAAPAPAGYGVAPRRAARR